MKSNSENHSSNISSHNSGIEDGPTIPDRCYDEPKQRSAHVPDQNSSNCNTIPTKPSANIQYDGPTQSTSAALNVLATKINEGIYGVVNQPMCDYLPSAKPPARKIDENHYGVVNQLMCDKLPLASFPAKKIGEDIYGVVNQPKSDGLCLATPPVRKKAESIYGVVNQPMSDLHLASPPDRKINEDDYGVVNQPICDSLLSVDPLTKKVSEDK